MKNSGIEEDRPIQLSLRNQLKHRRTDSIKGQSHGISTIPRALTGLTQQASLLGIHLFEQVLLTLGQTDSLVKC